MEVFKDIFHFYSCIYASGGGHVRRGTAAVAAVSCRPWIVRTDLRSSAHAASVPNCWVIPSAPKLRVKAMHTNGKWYNWYSFLQDQKIKQIYKIFANHWILFSLCLKFSHEKLDNIRIILLITGMPLIRMIVQKNYIHSPSVSFIFLSTHTYTFNSENRNT